MKDKSSRRRQVRTRAVLPVRVRGKDACGALFEGLAHTLDFTPAGARLGAIRHELNALDTLVVLFRQRRIEFKVMWTRLLGEHRVDGRDEYQVGLQMMAQETDPWGLGSTHSKTHPVTRASVVSAAA
jgi:hypothetical protein